MPFQHTLSAQLADNGLHSTRWFRIIDFEYSTKMDKEPLAGGEYGLDKADVSGTAILSNITISSDAASRSPSRSSLYDGLSDIHIPTIRMSATPGKNCKLSGV